MASNLQRYLAATKALSLVYSNRTLSRGDALQTLGGVPEKSFGDVVKKAGIIFTMVSLPLLFCFLFCWSSLTNPKVSNDSVLESLITNTINSGVPLAQKVFVDCSTVHPDTISSIATQLSAHKASFLCAPVFGGNPVATAGKLVFALAGATPDVREGIVKPLIQNIMGRKVIDCGSDPTKSSLLKIAGNIVTVSLMETVGEAQVFAEKTGLGTDAMEELITEAFGPIAGGYSKR
jgi:3-hydroxyisobutyrate dehydrogenase-like beta-hydroxyacid dehydrogenase